MVAVTSGARARADERAPMQIASGAEVIAITSERGVRAERDEAEAGDPDREPSEGLATHGSMLLEAASGRRGRLRLAVSSRQR